MVQNGEAHFILCSGDRFGLAEHGGLGLPNGKTINRKRKKSTENSGFFAPAKNGRIKFLAVLTDGIHDLLHRELVFVTVSSIMNETIDKAEDAIISDFRSVGAHYGYSRTRRHPSTEPFLLGRKNNVDIFDVRKTADALEKALVFMEDVLKKGGTVLFVGSKPEARRIMEEKILPLGVPYVTHRWVGGTLTNFDEMKKRIARLEDLEAKRSSGELSKYTKKEQLLIDREIVRLELNFGGLRAIIGKPDALLIIDPRHEHTAIHEAKRKNIPVIALASTDCNIEGINYPIPANDSSVSSIAFFLEKFAEAYKKGKAGAVETVGEAPPIVKEKK